VFSGESADALKPLIAGTKVDMAGGK